MGGFWRVAREVRPRCETLARGEHLIALKNHGIKITHGDLGEAESAELILYGGQGLRHGGGVLVPAPDPQLEGCVLELQNGVDRAELISRLLNCEGALSGAV